MRWKKAAAAGGAAIGAAALYNAAAVRGTGPAGHALAGEPGAERGELLWRGHRVAYTRHGAGSPVVLLHGIYAGASSLEWRHTVGALAERHTVYAVDLLGFGASARPVLRYTSALLQAMIGDVIARLVHEPCAVVATSLTAAHVVALVARDPRHVSALALVGPTGVSMLREPATAAQAAAELLLETPVVGTAAYNAIVSPASVRRFLEETYANDRLVTDQLVQAYVTSARQPNAKHAVGAFVGGRLNVDVRAPLRRIRQPLLLLWGEQARINPVQHAHPFRMLAPRAEWTLVPASGDLPHDEQPARVNAALLGFLERHLAVAPAGGTAATAPARPAISGTR